MGQDEIVAPDASVRPAEPSAGSSAIPTSPDALGEGGRVPSNRDLPDTTDHQRLICLPPVVDTLYLAFETTVRPDFATLNFAKPRTRGQGPKVEVGSWIIQPCTGHRGFTGYTHYATGTGERKDVLVMIGPPTVAVDVPNRRKVKVQIGSSVCWRAACKGINALGVAREVLRVLTGDVIAYQAPEAEVKARRVDTCMDVIGYDFTMEDLKRFCCRQKTRGVYESRADHPDLTEHSAWTSPTGSTYYLGRRGAASRFLRIYDKTMEAAVSGKLPWMEPIWEQNGWDGKARVWRIEIEHGSEWLTQHGFDSMLKLDGCERELWAHYLEGVRHTTGEFTRLERCPTSPVWQTITAAAQTMPSGLWRFQPRKLCAGKDVTKLIKMAVGCIESAITALSVATCASTSLDAVDIRAEVLRMVFDGISSRQIEA